MECPACQTPVDASQRFCPKCGALQPSAEAGSTPDPLVGTTLGGRYRIVQLLGEGGMGAVYSGEQQLGTRTRKVAIKTLHPHLSKDPKVKARFQREAGTFAELEHPNTIQVYDFGTTEEGVLYLVMEFVDGTNVADLLEKSGALEPPRVEKIMTQVCGSLEEAHSRGIIHRDLKPENIVLTERAGQKDFVKVLDFGIAKRSKEEDKEEQKLTQQGMVLGTPPYMSPEQFTGRPIDARSDIYSLGVMMYEMLTGRLPFNANTAWEWATQHMTVPPLAIESLPGGAQVPLRMKNAIMRALEKDPASRPTTVREFVDAFQGSATGLAAGAAAPPRPGTAPVANAPPATPVPPAREPLKGKTEMGEPLIPGGSFGPPPPSMGAPFGPPPASMGAPFAAPAVQPHHGTPSAGNQVMPAIPSGPTREQGGGGGRTMLLALIGIIGVLSVGALVYNFLPKRTNGGGLTLDLDAGASQVDIAPTSPGSSSPPPALDTSIATLSVKPPPVPPHHPTTPTTTHDAGVKPGPTTPPTTPTTPPTTPPKTEPPECADARRLAEHPALKKNPPDQAIFNLYQAKRNACISGGGKL